MAFITARKDKLPAAESVITSSERNCSVAMQCKVLQFTLPVCSVYSFIYNQFLAIIAYTADNQRKTENENKQPSTSRIEYQSF